MQTSTLAFTCPGCAGIFVASTPWKLTTAFRSAPSRASSSTTEPPKQNPIAASLSGIDLRQRGQRRERGAAPGAEFFRLGAKPADQGCDLLQIGRLPPVAEHVGGERDIAEPGEPTRAFHGEFAEPEPFVKHQHARPRPGSVSRRDSRANWPPRSGNRRRVPA